MPDTLRTRLPLILLLMFSASCNRPDPAADRGAEVLSLEVEPFVATGADPLPYEASLLSDSVAARLAAAGIARIRGPGAVGRAELVLGGTIMARNARVVVTVELRHPGTAPAMWTSSYWRDAAFGPAVEAVVAGVAEAIAAEAARRALKNNQAETR